MLADFSQESMLVGSTVLIITYERVFRPKLRIFEVRRQGGGLPFLVARLYFLIAVVWRWDVYEHGTGCSF